MKNITNNSATDMVAIFRVRVDVYSLAPTPPLPPRVNPKRSNFLTNRGDDAGAVVEEKNMRRYNNRYDNDGSSSGTAIK